MGRKNQVVECPLCWAASGHPSRLRVLIVLITEMRGDVHTAPKHSAFPSRAGLLGTITRITRNNVTG